MDQGDYSHCRVIPRLNFIPFGVILISVKFNWKKKGEFPFIQILLMINHLLLAPCAMNYLLMVILFTGMHLRRVLLQMLFVLIEVHFLSIVVILTRKYLQRLLMKVLFLLIEILFLFLMVLFGVKEGLGMGNFNLLQENGEGI